MKILKFFAFLTLFCLYVQADSFPFAKNFFYERNWQSALSKAQQKKQPLMVLFVTKTCPWCKKLENQVLSKPAINDFLHKNFTLVLLDKENDTYPASLQVDVVPTLYFVDSKTQKPFDAIVGYKNKNEFFDLIKQTLKNFKEK